MTTPAEQRRRAARLYLMACDAYGRGEPKIAEVLIQRANQYADQAAGLRSDNDPPLRKKNECGSSVHLRWSDRIPKSRLSFMRGR
jgi:hypothetical protein